MNWTEAAPAVSAAFLGSLVEVVEALTIVLAVVAVRGLRPALAGTLAALAVLVAVVLALGPLLGAVPLWLLQLVVGILLLLFGLGWLRKAALRAAGAIALHNQTAAYAAETAGLTEEMRLHSASQDWIAGLAAFKAVLLEGLEVIFIVIAVGAGGHLVPAGIGALAACALVFVAGAIVHKPLSQVPENTLKFAVGVMLSAFGVFWTGEGLGVEWPGHDLALLALAGVFLVAGLGSVAMARRLAEARP